MTPAAGWNERDYYAASRAARQAWQATNQQLCIGLDDGAVVVEAAAAPSSSPVQSPPRMAARDAPPSAAPGS